MPRVQSGAEIFWPETTNTTLPPIPEVVWQQPQESPSNEIHENQTTETHEITHMPKFKQRNDLQSQTMPIKETSPQVSWSSSEPLLENQTWSTPVQCLNDYKKQHPEIQRNEANLTANDTGDDNISPPKITTSHIEGRLVRDGIANELYMPLSSTIVLKRKKEMRYVPLDFQKGLRIDALIDSRASVSAIAQSELDRIKQEAPANIFKIDDPPNFQIQVANSQSWKPKATAKL